MRKWLSKDARDPFYRPPAPAAKHLISGGRAPDGMGSKYFSDNTQIGASCSCDPEQSIEAIHVTNFNIVPCSPRHQVV